MFGRKAYKTLPAGTCECFKCLGSGQFHSRGPVVNGRPTVNVGACYGCQGKGYQTKADAARNRAYWRHNIARLGL